MYDMATEKEKKQFELKWEIRILWSTMKVSSKPVVGNYMHKGHKQDRKDGSNCEERPSTEKSIVFNGKKSYIFFSKFGWRVLTWVDDNILPSPGKMLN